MKKTITFFAFILSLAVIIPCISSKTAFADELTVQSGDASVTVDTAPVASPATVAPDVSSDKKTVSEDVPVILPTNPFYFTKEFARGVRMFFTFGAVNKASYSLQVADEKAQELKQVEKLAPDNIKGIENAIDNYNQNVEKLKTQLISLKDNSNNPNVDKLLTKLAARALDHNALFETLKAENYIINQKINAAQSAISDTVSEASVTLDTPEKSQARLEKAVLNQPIEQSAKAQSVQAQSGIIKIINKIQERSADSKDAAGFQAEVDSIRSGELKKMEAVPMESKKSEDSLQKESQTPAASAAKID